MPEITGTTFPVLRAEVQRAIERVLFAAPIRPGCGADAAREVAALFEPIGHVDGVVLYRLRAVEAEVGRGRPENAPSGGQPRSADFAAPAGAPAFSGPEESASPLTFPGERAPADADPTTSEGAPSAPGPSISDLADLIWARAREAFAVDAQRFSFLAREIKRAGGRDVVAPTSILPELYELDAPALEAILGKVEMFSRAFHREASA